MKATTEQDDKDRRKYELQLKTDEKQWWRQYPLILRYNT